MTLAHCPLCGEHAAVYLRTPAGLVCQECAG